MLGAVDWLTTPTDTAYRRRAVTIQTISVWAIVSAAKAIALVVGPASHFTIAQHTARTLNTVVDLRQQITLNRLL